MFAKPNPKKQLWLNNRAREEQRAENERRDREARESYLARGIVRVAQ